MNQNSNLIAIVGLSFEFPQVKEIENFWDSLLGGVCLYHCPENISDTSFVPAWGSVVDKTGFDYRFFGYSYKEACYMDPQHRLLLQHSWHAMEQAGYMNQADLPVTGIFASASINNYLHNNLNSLIDANKEDELVLGNTLDFLATRIAYKLNLTGPAFTVQSGCSSSLTALHQARVALLTKQCDMALVGAVSLSSPDSNGYDYIPNGIRSKNGQIRAFDVNASGTVFTNGVAVLVLKRYTDAVENKDNILGIIRSTAINNDGMNKASFTAPSIQAQADVIRKALRIAQIKPEDIGLLEAHGTGTALGDPIEFEALLQVFGRNTNQPWCALQTVKSNVGHMDTVSGFAGLIKAMLALKHSQLPRQINFDIPNEKITLEGSPFYINKTSIILDKKYAGVTALGIGGTNAHVILQQPEFSQDAPAIQEAGILLLSAKSKTGLEALKDSYIAWCKKEPNANIAEIAYTSMLGRTAMDYRMAFSAESIDQLQNALLRTSIHSIEKIKSCQLAFMFPGQGAQYPNMGLELYQQCTQFQQILENHLQILEHLSGRSFKQILFSSAGESNGLYATENTQPILFLFEVALAKYLMENGIMPSVLFGHSLGEYSALVVSEALSFVDAAKAVLKRAELMAKTESGSMLSVFCNEKILLPLITPEINIAAHNTAEQFTVSGSALAIQQFQQRCADANIMTQALKTNHAFHSYLLEPILDEFKALVATLTFTPPRIPIISNLNGHYLSYEVLKEPEYWSEHMRRTVCFKACVERALEQNNLLFLEVGPGNTLRNFVKGIAKKDQNVLVANCLPHPKEKATAVLSLQSALSQLWQRGYPVNWPSFIYQKQNRVSLPLYPFELSSCWVKNNTLQEKKELVQTYRSFYREVTEFTNEDLSKEHFIILCEQEPTFESVAKMLAPYTAECLYLKDIAQNNLLNESRLKFFLDNLRTNDKKIHFIHALALESLIDLDWQQKQGRLGLLLLDIVNKLSSIDLSQKIKKISVLTHYALSFQSSIDPEIGLMSAMIKTINQECPRFSAKLIDLSDTKQIALANALRAKPVILACRGDNIFCERFEHIAISPLNKPPSQEGCVVILGGTGHVGMQYAKALLANTRQRLVLVQRSSLNKLKNPQTNYDKKKAEAISVLQNQYPDRIEIMQADIGDDVSIKSCIQEITNIHRTIGTLIHSAGVDASMHYKLMRDVDVSFFEQCFYAKRQGLLNIAELKQEFSIKHCHIVSSISSVLAGIGMYVYAGLHAYIDGFVKAQQKLAPKEWSSINWEAWEFGTEENELELFQQGSFGSHLNSLAINPEQGCQLIGRLMPQIQGQLIISSSDLQHRFDAWVEGKIESINQTLIERDTRPDLQSLYIKPRNSVEEQIMEVWSDILAINDIGIDDNFFELGGHSLSALQLSHRLTQQFNRVISVIELFIYPTIRKLADCLTEEPKSSSQYIELNKRNLARKGAVARMKSKSKECSHE